MPNIRKIRRTCVDARPRAHAGHSRHPAPTDKAGVQKCLGIVGYVHKFIPNMSEIANPLQTLLGKDVEWHWQFRQKKFSKNSKTN